MLFLNRERVVPVPEKATWLSSVVPGPYTTMRTIDGTCIVEFDRHIKRLVKAGQTVVSRIQGGKDEFKRELPNERALEVLANTGQLRDMVLEHIRASITCFHETVVLQGMRGEVEEALEKRITVLLNWGMSSDHEFVTCVNTAADGSCINTWVYVEELPPVPKAPVHVIIRRRPPEARMYEGKDSKWVIQRQRLEAEKGHANEVVLADERGRLLEGTQTNFYAVIDGVVWTASDEDVLAGTIREIVLRVCEQEGIPVKLEAPPVQSHTRWDGAFISSTSRLVLPIASIDVFQDCVDNPVLAGSRLINGECPIVTRIRERVISTLRSHSQDMGVEPSHDQQAVQ